MSDREGLLQAILDSPEDDVPRRTYADWLEDNGVPLHARFVRAGRPCRPPPSVPRSVSA